jgi:ribonuclease T2
MKPHLIGALLSLIALLVPSSAKSQQAGKFDYYLLSMSWSPEFCHSHPASPECSKHLGLIVHGLWPQYNGANRGPENCGNQPGPANPASLLDIMPTVSLVEHEWTTHGVCSGLSADDYFGLLRRIFTAFRIPLQLQHPTSQFIIGTASLKHEIEQSNSGLTDSEIALTCAGQYLQGVELCVTKDGKPQPCSGISECRGVSLRVPAVP